MKSLLTFALTVMLSMVMVAAAFGGAEGEAAATGGVTLTEPGTFPITEEPSEISLFTYGGAAEGDLPNSWLTAFLQEKTNVSIDFHLTPTERFKEQMNLMIASGEFVDVIIAQGNSLTQLSRPEEMRLIQQGILMPLDDLIETQSVWYKQRLDELPGFREAVTAPDGHIYDFGTVGGCFHCKYGQKMWINQTWLDRLGLEMPTNTDEFYQVMKAFKEQDANGNGDPNDEWPINTAKAGAWVQIDGFLMMPFQFSDVRQSQVRRLYVDDGTIKAAYMQPGYRDGLRYLKRMWDEGLIYPDSFTQDRNQSKRLNQSGEHAIFGAVPAMHHGYFSVGSGPEVRWREYSGVPPLDGPMGRETPYYGYPFNTGTTFLTSQARLPEVAFRLIDWLYSDEGSTAGAYGQEGKSWRSPEPGELAVNGKPAKIAPQAVPEDDPYYQNFTWGNRSSYYSFLHSWRSSHQDYMVPGPGDSERFLYVFSEVYEPFGAALEKMMPPLWYSMDSISELSQIYATLDEFVYESAVAFITGTKDIETEWDDYQDELRAIGVERYLEITQEAYDSSEFAK